MIAGYVLTRRAAVFTRASYQRAVKLSEYLGISIEGRLLIEVAYGQMTAEQAERLYCNRRRKRLDSGRGHIVVVRSANNRRLPAADHRARRKAGNVRRPPTTRSAQTVAAITFDGVDHPTKPIWPSRRARKSAWRSRLDSPDRAAGN
jgi:hypothetical protein